MTYTVKLFQEGTQWIAHLVERDLIAQADDIPSALDALSLLIQSREQFEVEKNSIH